MAMTSSGCGCVCGCQVSFGVLSSHKFPVCVPLSSRVWQPLYSFVGCAKKRENTRTHKKRTNTLKWIKKGKIHKKKRKGKTTPIWSKYPLLPPPPQLPCAVLVLPWPEGPPREPPRPPLCPSNGLFVLFRKEFLIGTFFILKRNLYIERCPLLSCFSFLGEHGLAVPGAGVGGMLTLPGFRGEARIWLKVGITSRKLNFGTNRGTV